MTQADKERYLKAAHAMQTGVMLSMDANLYVSDTTPKQLRVGVNSAMVDGRAICSMLIDKGIVTSDEIDKYLADAMEAEVELYKKELNLPPNITLG